MMRRAFSSSHSSIGQIEPFLLFIQLLLLISFAHARPREKSALDRFARTIAVHAETELRSDAAIFARWDPDPSYAIMWGADFSEGDPPDRILGPFPLPAGFDYSMIVSVDHVIVSLAVYTDVVYHIGELFDHDFFNQIKPMTTSAEIFYTALEPTIAAFRVIVSGQSHGWAILSRRVSPVLD